MSNRKINTEQADKTKFCFAIMPISDVETHPKGHFNHVYQDIIVPACEKSGFSACRADEVKASNLIQLDILKKLLDAPIAICDLSTRNPNVLFELGIRQAFDKPVVLIQEKGTPPIFDISGLRYLQYSKDMKYHEVLETQKELSDAINQTIGNNPRDSHVNSIVKLLSLSSPAQLPDLKDDKDSLAFDVIQTEMRSLRRQMQNLTKVLNPEPEKASSVNLTFFPKEENSFKNQIKRNFLRIEEEFFNMSRVPESDTFKTARYIELLNQLESLQQDLSPWDELQEKIIILTDMIKKNIANI